MIRQALHTIALAAALISPAWGAAWETDMTAAKAKATAEGKAILINFTGSDWCRHCRILKYAVFDTPEFASYVADKYVLMEVDLPRQKSVEATELEKRKELCKKYGVTGFPTVVLTNAAGEVLGGTVGGNTNWEGMRLHMEDALQRQQALTEARKLTGEARAQALAEIYREFPKRFEQAAAELRCEIAEHDPNDTTGMQQQAAADAQMQQLSAELSQCMMHDYQGKARIYDAYLSKANPRNTERIMERKRAEVIFPCLNIMLLNAKSTADILAARDYVLKEAETCYPAAIREEMIKALEEQFTNPEKMLEDIKKRRRR